MKRLLTIMICLVAGSAFAQQRSDGQWIGKVSGGTSVNSKGYFIEVGAEKIIKTSPSSIQFSFLYTRHNYSTKTEAGAKVNNYFGTLYYTYAFLTNSPVRFSLLAGAFLGQQDIPERIAEGVIVNPQSKFCYGLSFAAQVEFIVSRRISLYLQPTAFYNMPSQVEHFSLIAGAGVKVYF